MKILLFLILDLFLIQSFCDAQKKTKGTTIKKYSSFVSKIIKIDSIQTVYIIYATKGKKTLKIVSKKSSFCQNRIAVGKFYRLTTKSLFPPNTQNKLDVGGIGYEGVDIKLENDNGVVRNLFTCKELVGLCYL